MTHISPFVNDAAFTGGFLTQPVTQPTGTGLFGTSIVTGATGAIIPESERITNVLSEVQSSTNRILEGLKNSFLQVTQRNLIGLGEASLEISSALNEQIVIRERQRAEIVEALANQQIATNVINERLSGDLTEIGQSISQLGEGGIDPIKFLTDNPIFAGIGIGGLAVGAVVLLLVLR